jgi:hypothetical protein
LDGIGVGWKGVSGKGRCSYHWIVPRGTIEGRGQWMQEFAGENVRIAAILPINAPHFERFSNAGSLL